MNVSVVLCTYAIDMYEHFREAANSVLAQTHDDVELIVVVDGAQDLCERVSADYGDNKSVILTCNEKNKGLLKSRNRGAKIANGDVVAFIDDDAIADETWIEKLVHAYKTEDAIAAGGKMIPKWTAEKPSFLPEEFYWLIGVTHRGFADNEGEVQNTFGSNISFRREVFLNLEGFNPNIGGRQGSKNLQGGETELCVRMHAEYNKRVYYIPDAEVAHKVFTYRTNPAWLFDRAFWQGYSKRAMETLTPDTDTKETAFLEQLLTEFIPVRCRSLVANPSLLSITQLGVLFALTGTVGAGYLYGILKW